MTLRRSLKNKLKNMWKINDMITLPNKDVQVNNVKLNDKLDELLQESAEESSYSVNPLLVGTWFMVKTHNHIYICEEHILTNFNKLLIFTYYILFYFIKIY